MLSIMMLINGVPAIQQSQEVQGILLFLKRDLLSLIEFHRQIAEQGL